MGCVALASVGVGLAYLFLFSLPHSTHIFNVPTWKVRQYVRQGAKGTTERIQLLTFFNWIKEDNAKILIFSVLNRGLNVVSFIPAVRSIVIQYRLLSTP